MASVKRFPRKSKVVRCGRLNCVALSVAVYCDSRSITCTQFSPSKRRGGNSSSAFRLKFSNCKEFKFLGFKPGHATPNSFDFYMATYLANDHAIGRCSPQQIRKSLIFKHAACGMRQRLNSKPSTDSLQLSSLDAC